MMGEIKVIVEKFEDFLKRSVLPSASFILFLLIFDIVLNGNKIIGFLDEKHSNLTIGLFILAFIGLTNLLSMLQQGIYDNRLKGNFNAFLFGRSENEELDKLRKEVNAKLKEQKEDYALYQVLGKSMDISKRYVNEAKSFGIIFVSLMMVTFIYICSLFAYDDFSFLALISAIIFLVILYFVGFDLVKSGYRSRAKRIYLNYLNEGKKEKA